MAQIKAPELRSPYGWVHGGPFQLADFRGKLVLLDFWTLGCINCQHILPDLRRLEEEFPDTLVVIGVHSAKFSSEQQTRNIHKAILKFGIHHPVINDADLRLWEEYAVRAWPTSILIDPDGFIIGQHSGEGVYQALRPAIMKALETHSERLVTSPSPYQQAEEEGGNLRFPTKLSLGPEGSIFVADTGHHRILNILPSGQVQMAVGSGEPGFRDGNLMQAQFRDPQGLAWKTPELIVADTGNHAIRSVDFSTGQVTTLAGTGEMGYYWDDEAWNEPVLPNSPWDLALVGSEVFVANAGNHQILRLDLDGKRTTFRWAGTGHESLHNAPRQEACFSQPSGITYGGMHLYVADTEASVVRRIHLITGQVDTLLGDGGRSSYGDEEGPFDTTLLQHPVGIATQGDRVFIADTYNDKIKVADLNRERVKTLAGGFDEPNGLVVMDKHLYLTNTHMHKLIRIDLDTFRSEVVSVYA
ncbi:MAG TPA: hypothetical protein DCE41_33990 [Cytophagales bacterium]|nr:hypothetical protein [Cytophagales bacterium]HAA23511.1 hypothetical protein [Cytophagales bacterium]